MCRGGRKLSKVERVAQMPEQLQSAHFDQDEEQQGEQIALCEQGSRCLREANRPLHTRFMERVERWWWPWWWAVYGDLVHKSSKGI